ncbi:822_t:CDS:2, partial [Racocetra persica]
NHAAPSDRAAPSDPSINVFIFSVPVVEKGLYSIAIVVDTLLCLVAAFGLFAIFVVIYFAMVINAYAENRKAKEDGNYIPSDVIETPGSNLYS